MTALQVLKRNKKVVCKNVRDMGDTKVTSPGQVGVATELREVWTEPQWGMR